MALVQVDGRTVEYTTQGEGEVVLLSSPSWWPLDAWKLSGIPELADTYRVVAFNHRGIGASQGTPTDYTVASLAEDTLALLDALGVPSAHLVGFAIGATIALKAARLQPGRVRSLVLAAAGAGERVRGPRTVPPAVLAELHAVGYRDYIRGHALNDDFAFHPTTYLEHPERAAALADALWEHAGTEQEFLKHVMARQGYDTTDQIEQVTQPTLVIVGAEDNVRRGYSTPLGVAHALAEGLPNAQLEIVPGTRHMLFWEEPEACWSRVKRFLATA